MGGQVTNHIITLSLYTCSPTRNITFIWSLTTHLTNRYQKCNLVPNRMGRYEHNLTFSFRCRKSSSKRKPIDSFRSIRNPNGQMGKHETPSCVHLPSCETWRRWVPASLFWVHKTISHGMKSRPMSCDRYTRTLVSMTGPGLPGRAPQEQLRRGLGSVYL